MTQKDYYELLGISRSATGEDVKKAYRKLALQYHPDRNPDDPEAEQYFKEVTEAYEVLSDENKRAAYDRFGHAGVSNNGQQDFGGGGEDIFDAFSDIFGDIFGFSSSRGGGGARAYAGADLKYNLKISFEEAVKGTETELQIPKEELCSECGGNGSEPGHNPETCKHCGGRGQIFQSQGFFRIASTCPVCRGAGKMITHPCKTCKGNGIITRNKNVNVKIPAGVDNGSRLRIQGEGEPGMRGGPPGDLYVVIHVEEHSEFTRQGQNIIVSVEINMVQAALGDRIEVPTLDGPVQMDIPRETQNGQTFKMKGLGVPYINSNKKGNLVVQVKVNTPTNLNKRQEELLREFAEHEVEKPKSKMKNFFKKAMGES